MMKVIDALERKLQVNSNTMCLGFCHLPQLLTEESLILPLKHIRISIFFQSLV